MRILIADDDITSRSLLSSLLNKLGYDVVTAIDGADAWEILQREKIQFVITDWLMPNMDGVELCRHIRKAGRPYYTYTILLTSKGARIEIIEGMEAGADDFIIKPFNIDELNLRIRAGERILNLEKDLEQKNNKLSEAYTVIRKDLEAAAKIQSSLLPKTSSDINGVLFDWLFLPSAFVAGDIFNYFLLDEKHIGFYLLDVSGHGIQAALLSVTLSKVLSPAELQKQTLTDMDNGPANDDISNPSKVVRLLNHRFQSDDDIMQYFTIIYGVIDTENKRCTLTQAGHPSPIILKTGKEASLIGTGGFPVGMFPDADYNEHEFSFDKGDRLILYSDGITECADINHENFSIERLIKITEEGHNLSLKELLAKIDQELRL